MGMVVSLRESGVRASAGPHVALPAEGGTPHLAPLPVWRSAGEAYSSRWIATYYKVVWEKWPISSLGRGTARSASGTIARGISDPVRARRNHSHGMSRSMQNPLPEGKNCRPRLIDAVFRRITMADHCPPSAEQILLARQAGN